MLTGWWSGNHLSRFRECLLFESGSGRNLFRRRVDMVECLLRIAPKLYFFHDGVKMSTYCVGGSQRQGKDAVLRCFAGYYKQLRCFFFAMLVRRARDMTCEGEGVFEILLDIMISRRSCFWTCRKTISIRPHGEAVIISLRFAKVSRSNRDLVMDFLWRMCVFSWWVFETELQFRWIFEEIFFFFWRWLCREICSRVEPAGEVFFEIKH